MTIEEIRKNAPEGATHYRDSEYYMVKGSSIWRWIGKWLYMSNCDNAEKYESLLLKPL